MTAASPSLGVVGRGVVGSTVYEHARERGFDIIFHDPVIDGSSPLSAVAQREYVFVCVPTPGAPGRLLDASIVKQVVAALRDAKTRARAIILKSTLSPGTFAELRKSHPPLPLCYVPEFLRASARREDFARPDRTVIASDDPAVAQDVSRLYQSLVDDPRVVFGTPAAAEVAKLASNAFLALKVTFANELFDAAVATGLHWSDVARLVALDSRIGASHLDVTPERGFAGACLPKDVSALEAWVTQQGQPATLLAAMLDVNQRVRSKHT